MRHYIVLPLLLLLAMLPGAAGAAQDITVGGISPAMTPEEVKAKLGPEWDLAQTANIIRGKAFNFTKGHEAFSLLTLGPRIVYIDHQQIFANDAPIVATELTRALDEKYGQPTMRGNDTPDDLSEIWLIGKDGVLLNGPSHVAEAKACADYAVKGPFLAYTQSKISFDFAFPEIPVKAGLENCGTVIIAAPAKLGLNGGLITRLSVSVFDIKAANDWVAEETKAYDKRLADEVEAARKNKPNL